MPFGTIGSLKTSYQRTTTVAQVGQLEQQKQNAENVLAKFREVGADLVSLNQSPNDKLPDDPRKVVAQRPRTMKPRFESSSAQTAFKVAQFLLPPLFLLDSETFAKPSLSGVAALDEQSRPTQLNAKVGANPGTGESHMELDYQIAEDGTEKYEIKTFKPVTVADAWYQGKPLGQVKQAVLPQTETVEVRDGEVAYSTKTLNLSTQATHLELFESGLKLG